MITYQNYRMLSGDPFEISRQFIAFELLYRAHRIVGFVADVYEWRVVWRVDGFNAADDFRLDAGVVERDKSVRRLFGLDGSEKRA